MSQFSLVVPGMERLESYMDAVARGFSHDTLRDVSQEELAKLQADAEGHLARMNASPEGLTVTLPNGTKVPRLPMITRWMWDGDFAGTIKFRYVPNSNELPPHVLGHVGYAVPEWKRGRGYATQALNMMLMLAERVGVTEMKITCDPDNEASQKVITGNGGRFVKEIVVPEFGNAPRLLFVLPTGGESA